jgi:Tfp pilus assembly protein PilO
MRLDLKTLDLSCLGVIAATAAAIAVGTARLAAATQSRLRADKSLSEQRLRVLQEAQTNLNDANGLLQRKRSEWESIGRFVGEHGQFALFVEDLGLIMQRRRVVLVDLKPESGVREGTLVRVPMELTCTGPFQNVHHVLHDLATMERLLRVEKLVLTGTAGEAGCRMTLRFSIFER